MRKMPMLAGAGTVLLLAVSAVPAEETPVREEPGQGSLAQGDPRRGMFGFPDWDSRYGRYDRSRRPDDKKAEPDKAPPRPPEPPRPPAGDPRGGPFHHREPDRREAPRFEHGPPRWEHYRKEEAHKPAPPRHVLEKPAHPAPTVIVVIVNPAPVYIPNQVVLGPVGCCSSLPIYAPITFPTIVPASVPALPATIVVPSVSPPHPHHPHHPGTVVPEPPRRRHPHPAEATPGDEGRTVVAARARTAATVAADRGELIVDLPTDARLYVHNQPTKATSAQRHFTSPPLDPNKIYWYELRMELQRDGKIFTETQRVALRAGEVTRANFRDVEGRAVARK